MNVILIHGQGRSPLSMTLLGWRLRQQHYQVYYFGYISLYETFEGITDRFVRMIRARVGAEPYVIVSHSLGGLITRASLPDLSDHPPQHLIMLAPPNQPAWLAKKAHRIPLYRWATGDCGRKLTEDAFYKTLPLPDVPTTIIAGSRGPRGKLSPFREALNDSVLTVEETKLGQGCEVILIPATHALIMNSKDVARIIKALIS